jgi:hypothetical protein
MLSPLTFLKEFFMKSLSPQANDLQSLSQSVSLIGASHRVIFLQVFSGEFALLLLSIFPHQSCGSSFHEDSPFHTLVLRYYDALWTLSQLLQSRAIDQEEVETESARNIWRNILSSITRFQIIFPTFWQQGMRDEEWAGRLMTKMNQVIEVLLQSLEKDQVPLESVTLNCLREFKEKTPPGVQCLTELGVSISKNSWLSILSQATLTQIFSDHSNFQWSLVESPHLLLSNFQLSCFSSFGQIFSCLPSPKMAHPFDPTEILRCLTSWMPPLKKLVSVGAGSYQKSLCSERIQFLSLVLGIASPPSLHKLSSSHFTLDLLIKYRWHQFFAVEICHLVNHRTKSPFLSHAFPSDFPSVTILNCNLRHRSTELLSPLLSLEHAVMMAQAAANMQSLLMTKFSQSSSKLMPPRLDLSSHNLDDEDEPVRSIATQIFVEIESYYALLYDQISSNQMMNPVEDGGQQGPPNLDIWLDVLNLFNLFRTWAAIERCVQHVVEFSTFHHHHASSSLRTMRPLESFVHGKSSDVLELGKQMDEFCKLLSDYTPPHPSLSSSMSKLLSLGLIDATFKWRESLTSSAQFDDHREDVWWEGIFPSRMDPGGLLGQVGLVLNIAATELAKDENERTNRAVPSITSSPSLTATEKQRLVGNIWMCVPAVVILIECTSLTEPQVTNRLSSSLLLF